MVKVSNKKSSKSKVSIKMKRKTSVKNNAKVKGNTKVSTKITKLSEKSAQTSCVYSHVDVDKLLDSTPKFSKFYHLMTVLVYIGIMAIVWITVYYAYTINKPAYLLLCSNCSSTAIYTIKGIASLWLFALYFYFLCELRCRAWDLCIFTKPLMVRKTNKWILALSFLFTGLTSVLFWF